ncbi:MAG: asparagine synthase C-terminal domain-containing protein [Planctomycetes bacterium]|nr:asparagine synthase C-terminal domain-containing protein [Planctomycetota bacterium]
MKNFALWYSNNTNCDSEIKVLKMLNAIPGNFQVVKTWSNKENTIYLAISTNDVSGNIIEKKAKAYAAIIDGVLIFDQEKEVYDKQGKLLLEKYIECEKDMLVHAAGAFVAIIIDSEKNKVILARDPIGEKMVYYASGKDWFAASNHFNSFSTISEVDKTIDIKAVSSYLQLQAIGAPLTIYKGVKKLQSGTFAVVTNLSSVSKPTVSINRYYDTFTNLLKTPKFISLNNAVEIDNKMMQQNLIMRLGDTQNIGSMLSSGYDSALVTALSHRIIGDRLSAYTVGFSDSKHDERKYASKIAKHIGISHEEEILNPKKAIELIPETINWFGEPFADNSAIPAYLGWKLLGESNSIGLTGNGADTAFGGGRRYRKIENIHKISRWLGLPTMVLPNNIRGAISLTKLVFNEGISVFPRHIISYLTGEWPQLPDLNRVWRNTIDFPAHRRAMAMACNLWPSNSTLMKDERIARLCGIESHSPFIDRYLVDFVMQLPDHLTRDKIIVTKLTEKYLPLELLNNPKSNFGMPAYKWFANELEPMLMDLVTKDNLSKVGIHRFSPIESLLKKRKNLRIRQGRKLWLLLILVLWSKQNS